jgi:hypothetical protein
MSCCIGNSFLQIASAFGENAVHLGIWFDSRFNHLVEYLHALSHVAERGRRVRLVAVCDDVWFDAKLVHQPKNLLQRN